MAERGDRAWTRGSRRPREADLRPLRGRGRAAFGPAFASGFKAWRGPVPRSAIMCDPQDLQCAASAASATVPPPLLPAFIVSFAMPSSDPADVKKVAAIVWIRVQIERLGISMDELEAAGCFDWVAAPARQPIVEPVAGEAELDAVRALLPAGPITAPPALLPAGPITAPPVVAPAPLRKAEARKRAHAPVRQSAPPVVPVAAPVAAPVVAAAVAAEAVPAEKPAAASVAEPVATPAVVPAPARATMSVPAQKARAVRPAAPAVAPAAAPAQVAEAVAAPAAAAAAPAPSQASAPARRYRNAEGQVWDGVGPMPAWLLRAVNAGQSVEHFRVN